MAVIVQDGLRRMYGENPENVFYYITTLNENYAMPGHAWKAPRKAFARVSTSWKPWPAPRPRYVSCWVVVPSWVTCVRRSDPGASEYGVGSRRVQRHLLKRTGS